MAAWAVTGITLNNHTILHVRLGTTRIIVSIRVQREH